ncbi:MAG: hypothetical protein QOH08_2575 [Chloroflexota bacterium]|jgi:uncharacterized membrane protein HdeD (DUF308 family)|nr:hypothetical protein [Chloroflexota bacterium]
MNTAVHTRARDWWLLALRGVAAILFGIGAFIWPGLTIAVLVILFGAYALVDGILELYVAFRLRARRPWGGHLIQGVAGVVAGLIALLLPTVAAISLILLIGAWAIVTGITEIFLTIQLRDRVRSEWLWVLTGLASIAFGLALLAFPVAGALALAWFIGAYALWIGVLLIALGMSLRTARPVFS